MKLNIKAMALTGAIFCGMVLFLVTWWIILMDGASTGPVFLGKIYRGYSVTPVGSIIGFLWAFVDGAFSGALIAWIYNQFVPEKRENRNGNHE